MLKSVRRTVLLLATTLGIAVAATAPAAAGVSLSNHCEPTLTVHTPTPSGS